MRLPGLAPACPHLEHAGLEGVGGPGRGGGRAGPPGWGGGTWNAIEFSKFPRDPAWLPRHPKTRVQAGA